MKRGDMVYLEEEQLCAVNNGTIVYFQNTIPLASFQPMKTKRPTKPEWLPTEEWQGWLPGSNLVLRHLSDDWVVVAQCCEKPVTVEYALLRD